ncbi:DNA/RNA non-specific endonuclease [Verrucomicrobium spinosum]
MERSHLVPHQFNGSDTFENLITAFADDNDPKMRNVERRIEALAKSHKAVCILVTPIYRKYNESGEAFVPKYIMYNVVTSDDNGGKEWINTAVKLRDVFRLDNDWWSSAGPTLTPIN